MLLSGVGVLAFGLVSLWRGARDAERVAETELRKSAQVTARTLRALLLDPHTYDDVAREESFVVRDGALVVPDEIGWLDTPPPEELSEREREALRLEFALGDRKAARAVLAKCPEGALQGALLAERDGDLAERDALLERCDGRPGWLLVHARAGRALPATAAEALQGLAPEAAHALVERIAELAPGLATTELTSAIDRCAKWRERLRRVRTELTALANGPRLLGTEIVFPRLDASGLQGGVSVPFQALVERLRARAPEAWSGTVGLGTPTGDSAIVALPGIAFVEPELSPSGAGPYWLAVLLVVLTATCWIGALFAIRALRREAKAMAARAEFLTTVTHELKTPLAGIRVVAEMLEDGTIASATKRHEYHAMLVGESQRLSTLVENVLDLGRVERRERAYDRRAHDLGELVREVVELFAPTAARAGLAVECRLCASATVRVDRDAFVQALLNVLDNARKYATSGQRVEVVQDGQRVHVRDHGPGVATAERSSVFERFVRGRSHSDGSVPGIGLGLHLAREILRAHGGDLRLEEPQVGSGALFVFVLPEETS